MVAAPPPYLLSCIGAYGLFPSAFDEHLPISVGSHVPAGYSAFTRSPLKLVPTVSHAVMMDKRGSMVRCICFGTRKNWVHIFTP